VPADKNVLLREVDDDRLPALGIKLRKVTTQRWETLDCECRAWVTGLRIAGAWEGDTRAKRVDDEALVFPVSVLSWSRLDAFRMAYAAGCSKWNPIEHRLFGPISLNWAGHPLRSRETMLAYRRGTTTTTGLRVQAVLHDAVYEKGRSVSDAELAQLNLEPHTVCPPWNYTVRPRSSSAPDGPARPSGEQVIL
jgi:hypothetical protein